MPPGTPGARLDPVIPMLRRGAPLLLTLMLLSSLAAAGLGMMPQAAAQPEPERDAPYDGDAAEWEQQVSNDARGDVLVRHTGSIDLYYMVVGELFPINLGESYIIFRVGYGLTDAEDSDTSQEPPEIPGVPLGAPRLAPEGPAVHINVTFNVSSERSVRFSLLSTDLGASWQSDGGRLVFENTQVDDNREVMLIAPLRRFALEEGDTLSDYNISSYRKDRLVDTMEGYDPANDFLPDYPSPRRIAEDPTGTVPAVPVPLPVPLPVDPNDPPVPLPEPEPPVPLPNATDAVPDQVPYPPDTGDQGIPYGAPTRDDVERFVEDPGSREDPIVDPDRPLDDPTRTSGAAWNTTHTVTDGTSRFIVRADDLVVRASLERVGFANFTVESLFKETPQRVLMLASIPDNSRWLFRYGLDTPTGVKDLPADGTIRMSAIAAPSSLFATAQLQVTFIFLSDWGGLELVPVTFVNTAAPDADELVFSDSPQLPRSVIMDFISENDPWRVNEERAIRFEVRRGDNFRYLAEMEQVRAYIHPAGAPVPDQPYQLNEDDLQPGTYRTPFVFDRPGAWVINVQLFDYQPDEQGRFPSTTFLVHVDYGREAKPLLPAPVALGSVVLVGLAVAARERLQKTR